MWERKDRLVVVACSIAVDMRNSYAKLAVAVVAAADDFPTSLQ